jgi:hypothetical protein
MRKLSACILVVFLSSLRALTAASFGDVRGLVHDPSHRPIAGAEVVLLARASDYKQTTQTDENGEFHFSAVPVGEYLLQVQREGFAGAEQPVVVTSGAAPILHFPLSIAAQQQSVEVSETAEALNLQQMTPQTLVSRQQIERAPGADRTNSVAMITDFVPGSYVIHDQLHVRGGHQVSWLVDGVPVPNTNIATNVGPQFNPQDIDYLEVQRGSYSAAYGDRTYGVFNIVPRTGFERNNEAELSLSYGQFHQTNDVFSYGGHSDRFAYYFSVNGSRSDLGLATPTAEILHDQTSGGGGFASFIYNLRPSDQLRLVTSLRGDHYQIPNSPEDQEAGVRDVENERDALVNFSWVHTIRDGTLLTVSPFYHFNRADYLGGPNNPELSATDKHASQYGGAQISLRAVTKRHNATAGIYAFGQHDVTDFGLSATGDGGLMLAQTNRAAGHLEAVFLEDQYKPVSWLTLTGGVRLTHFSGAISENAASPRVGAALRIPRLGWVLRGFYGRYYQAPPLETISGPLAIYAVEQGVGFLPLYGERNEENQFGLTIPWRGWSFDLDHFNTRTHNFFDHDALGNSNIFLPLTIDRAHVSAFEVALRSPLLLRRGRMHLAYSNQRAEAWGPVSGGLTDFEPPPDGRFLLDHDQRHTLSVGGFVNLLREAWVSANLNYGSGFPDEGGPARLEAHTTVDLALGKSFGERWSIAVNAVNVANRHFLLDNSPTFGGTHYSNPREIYAQVKYRFHF